jgi:uncharacterized protein (TIGR03437 family)
VCRLSVAGLNQARRVTGQIRAECPSDLFHTNPFGNWGVTSNFGQKANSHQFQGWCHDMRPCDNTGSCRSACADGWYEWNSCTDHSRYSPPNCSLYNAADCTEQATSTGINVHGTRYVDIPVRCPVDTNGDGIPDEGGCRDVPQYSTGTNFMSLYELDPVCCDQLVQTVYFPPLTLPLACDVFGCAAISSDWVSPVAWDSPASPPKVFAQLAAVVNWGGFVDQNRACRLAAPVMNVVSAASFTGPNLAPESIATALGDPLAPTTIEVTSLPLPTSLAGFSVQVTDRNGITRAAPLFYISPRQVNFAVPAGTPAGTATVSAFSGEILRASSRVQIEAVAPALFTQNADGKGVAAAIAVRYSPGGLVTWAPVYACGAAPGSCVPAPIDVGGPGETAYLVLFGSGIRNRSALTSVGVVIGGLNARADYAGPQGQYAGLDQVNIPLPRELAGRGVVNVELTVDGKPANIVQVAFR